MFAFQDLKFLHILFDCTRTWQVVEFKQQSRLEEKRKKALDLHLSFIVDQTEKYSSWLTEGLVTAQKTTPDTSLAGSTADGQSIGKSIF